MKMIEILEARRLSLLNKRGNPISKAKFARMLGKDPATYWRWQMSDVPPCAYMSISKMLGATISGDYRKRKSTVTFKNADKSTISYDLDHQNDGFISKSPDMLTERLKSQK